MQCRFCGRRAAGEETVIMGRPKTYSDELRRRAVDEVLERDRKVPEVAKQLGIDPLRRCAAG